MLRNIFLVLIFTILGYAFYMSSDFKEILAGVAIFLFGMMALEDGFKAFSGGLLEKILEKATDKTYKSIAFGAAMTTIMQSSSLVSVLTISFIGAGLVGLVQGIGIIFGANLGTTTGAWLVAGLGLKVKISAYAMPMLVFGLILVFQKSKSLKGVGYILTGLGFLFLGISHMKEGFEAFKDTLDLSSFGGVGLKYLFIFTAIGIAATVIMQSSHATLVLIITALFVGQISYENALALAIGANVGTTITAIIGAMSSNIAGKRLAGAHLIFNLTTGLIAIVFINQLVYIVDHISVLIGIANDNYTLKLAVFHTVFNVIGVVVMTPFISQLARFLENTLKAKPVSVAENVYTKPKYLNESIVASPDALVASIAKEAKHLFNSSFSIITRGLNLDRHYIKSNKDIHNVGDSSRKMENMNILYNKKIKGVLGEILEYSTKTQDMNSEQVDRVGKIRDSVGDISFAVKGARSLQKNMIDYEKTNNTFIKKEYEHAKICIANTLRLINLASKAKKEYEVIFLLSKTITYITRYNILSGDSLNKLIKDSKITAQMASSLMNDNNYTSDICSNLVSMAQTLFVKEFSAIVLDNKEIVNLLKSGGKDENIQKFISSEFLKKHRKKYKNIDNEKAHNKLSLLYKMIKDFNKKAHIIVEQVNKNTDTNSYEVKRGREDLRIIKSQIKKINKVATKILNKKTKKI